MKKILGASIFFPEGTTKEEAEKALKSINVTEYQFTEVPLEPVYVPPDGYGNRRKWVYQ